MARTDSKDEAKVKLETVATDTTTTTTSLQQQPELADDEDESDDEDFDPNAEAKADAGGDDDDDSDDGEAVPDYSHLASDVSLIKTRRQRYQETLKREYTGLVTAPAPTVDVDEIFAELSQGAAHAKTEWLEKSKSAPESEKEPTPLPAAAANDGDLQPQTITIKLTYAFAGKIVTETKTVDANLAEAKAYLNSTAHMALYDEDKPYRLFVPVMRTVPGELEPRELRIKLKRPLLIDKFLSGSGKKIKLSTLEKSRLDWALFVDKRDIQDELKIGNRDGYLEKQDFLGRLDAKRDENYQKAKDEDRRKRFLLQQQQGS